MKHSVEAYLKRLPKNKVEQLWKVWVLDKDVPPYISSEWVELLKQRMKEIIEQENTP